MPSALQSEHVAWRGEKPWTRAGVEVAPDASIDEIRSAAKLDWGTELKPLSYEVTSADVATRVDVGWRAMVRSDTGALLDIVGPKTIPAQNEEVLAFFRDYLAVGALTLNAAGLIQGGRYVWGLAKLGRGFTLPGGDEVGGHLLVANANKYGKGLIVKLVAERFACWNQVTISLTKGNKVVSIPHNQKFDVAGRAHALAKLGLATDAFASLQKEAETFSELRLDDRSVDRVLAATFRLPALEAVDDTPVWRDTRGAKRVRELFAGAGEGATLISAAGTGWGLLNAVTQYLDHEHGRGDDTRLRNAWFEGGETVKKRARTAIWAEAAR